MRALTVEDQYALVRKFGADVFKAKPIKGGKTQRGVQWFRVALRVGASEDEGYWEAVRRMAWSIRLSSVLSRVGQFCIPGGPAVVTVAGMIEQLGRMPKAGDRVVVEYVSGLYFTPQRLLGHEHLVSLCRFAAVPGKRTRRKAGGKPW